MAMARVEVFTTEPLEFVSYLRVQNERLYKEVKDLIIFEEVSLGKFRMQKLYKNGVWSNKTEREFDSIWVSYCGLHP